jgi:hypothetical protein
MKNKTFTMIIASAILALVGTVYAGPQIDTGTLRYKLAPKSKQAIQKPARKGAMRRIAKAQVRPVRADHSARPARNWCETRSASTIPGRVGLNYNYPGPSSGPPLRGVLKVYTNGGVHSTNVTIYPGMNKRVYSDSVQFRWQDACPPKRVGVKLVARSAADKERFMPVIVYAAPDRADRPNWY